jgi:hypothetical protein
VEKPIKITDIFLSGSYPQNDDRNDMKMFFSHLPEVIPNLSQEIFVRRNDKEKKVDVQLATKIAQAATARNVDVAIGILGKSLLQRQILDETLKAMLISCLHYKASTGRKQRRYCDISGL